MSFEAIGQVLGMGMGGLGGGLLGAGAGGLAGAGTGAVEGGEAGAVAGLGFPPAEPETIGAGVIGGAVVGGATGAAGGGYEGAIAGAGRGRSIGGLIGRSLDHVFNQTSDADEKAKAVPDQDAGTCQTCPDPCKDLRRGKGLGDYRGGADSQMTKPARDGLQSHHMPSDAASQDALDGKLTRGSGPAIQMLKADHKETLSYGYTREAQDYQDTQTDLIKQGRYMEAFDNDAADVRRVAQNAGDPGRYDQAIKEAQDYAECVDKNRVQPIQKEEGQP